VRVAPFLAIFFLSVLAGLQPARAATEIPFAYRAGMIWLKVGVAGQSTSLNFLLDSGAGRSVLHLGTAQRLGVKLGARETVQGVDGRCAAYRVESFAATVAAATSVPREVLALDLSPVSAGCGARIDGLLGADFFRERIVQIDFAAQKIRLLNRNELPTSSAQILSLASRNDAFCVRVSVDQNAPQWMRLDTGCSSALEWVVTDAKSRRATGTSVAAAAGSSAHSHTAVLLGSERLSSVKTGVHQQPIFSGEAGLLGNGLLSQFRVTVDAGKSRLFLDRIQ
jgi:hypothetical protein